MRMIIVSGLSGSGKSIALQTLEDSGYYCVDNLPVTLLKPFAETLLTRAGDDPQPTAVGIDARNFLDDLSRFPDVLDELKRLGLEIEILFLHASDDALLQRYSATRRRHPLSHAGLPLADAIRQERQLLEALSACATLIIDSSQCNIYDLRDLVKQRLAGAAGSALTLLFESFGFKNGVPADADYVFDVRCLPNPHWEPKLRQLTGLDLPVVKFLAASQDAERMIGDLRDFLDGWVPSFETGSRSYLTTAVGCTGGQHRSVYVVKRLSEHFSTTGRSVLTRHRELAR